MMNIIWISICSKTNKVAFYCTLMIKGDSFNFEIINFTYLDSNILDDPASGVYTSRLVIFVTSCVKWDEYNPHH